MRTLRILTVFLIRDVRFLFSAGINIEKNIYYTINVVDFTVGM